MREKGHFSCSHEVMVGWVVEPQSWSLRWKQPSSGSSDPKDSCTCGTNDANWNWMARLLSQHHKSTLQSSMAQERSTGHEKSQNKQNPGADPGFLSGGPSRVLTPRGVPEPKISKTKNSVSLKIAWKLHDFEKNLGQGGKGARGQGGPDPLDPLVKPVTNCQKKKPAQFQVSGFNFLNRTYSEVTMTDKSILCLGYKIEANFPHDSSADNNPTLLFCLPVL